MRLFNIIPEEELRPINGPQIPDTYVRLISALKALPGIELYSEHFYFDYIEPIHFNFKVTNQSTLFFIARSIDPLYWNYGQNWSISLSVVDIPTENPLIYCLKPNDLCYTLAEQTASSLYAEMLFNLNNDNMLTTYNIDINQINHYENPDLDIRIVFPDRFDFIPEEYNDDRLFSEPNINDNLPF